MTIVASVLLNKKKKEGGEAMKGRKTKKKG